MRTSTKRVLPFTGLAAALAVFFVATVALVGPARAAILAVTNTNDSGPGSLRKAINTANGNGRADTITFNLAPGRTITLTSGGLYIDESLTIEGPGAKALSVSGNDEWRVFEIKDRAEVTISGLTITGGDGGYGAGIYNLGVLTVAGSTITGNGGTYGGGIYNEKSEDTVDGGTLTVKNSTVSGNTASGFTTSSGGGIVNDGGTLTVTRSTIARNTADWGGGIFSEVYLPGRKTTITDSTISGNLANDVGGGLYNYDGTTSIEYSTIKNNTAPRGFGGGVANDGGGGASERTKVSSSIIAGNRGTDADTRFSGNTFTSEGYNLIGDGDAARAFDATGDRVKVTNPGRVVTGTRRDNTLRGTLGSDIIAGSGGDDTVRGRGGGDVVRGGAGNDVLKGEGGKDRLYGQSGRDRLNARDGVRGNDLANGGSGKDGCKTDRKDRRVSC